MRKNTLKEIWASGGATLNGWCSIPSSFSAEIMAHQGFDSITIDMQHGLVDYTDAVTMLQAISTTDVIPIARVPWSDPARLMKILDAGSYGVICPMINTAEEAEDLVRACKYPPWGFRSFGPIRAKYYGGGATHGGGDYHNFADEETLVIPQIETRQAIEQPRPHPRGAWHRRHLHRPLGPRHGAGHGAAQGPDRPRVHRGGRDDPRGRQAPRRSPRASTPTRSTPPCR